MEDNPQPEEESKLTQGVKLTAVAWVTELALLVVGVVVLGATYTAGVHVAALVIAVPIALYLLRRWIKGR